MLKPGWIITAIFPMFPLWWLLGLGGFVYPIAGMVLIGWVLGHRRLMIPPSTGLFVLFLGWVLLSFTQLDSGPRGIVFFYRFFAYVAAVRLLIYVINERRVTREWIIRMVGIFWIMCVIGGWVGLLIPTFRMPATLASILFPRSLSQNEFLGQLIRPGVAQLQVFLGFPLPRPKTFFGYTNDWGGNLGLLTPFFVVAFLRTKNLRRRRIGKIMLVVAVPPIVISVNRGLWISIALYVVYLAVRGLMAGRAKQAGAGLVLGAIVLGIVVSPLGSIVQSRLESTDADTREGIYQEAIDGAFERPILGWGGPRPSSNPESPAIGTHGHIFLLIFSHGFVGAALFCAWLLAAVVLAARRDDLDSVHLSAVLVIGVVQMLFYNLLPVSIPLMALALGLCLRGPDPTEQPVTAIA